MTQKAPKSVRRIWVIVNTTSVISILVMNYLYAFFHLNKIYLLFEIIPLIFIILSFRIVFVKTHLWKLTHSKKDKLDERQVQIVYGALSKSYTIFVLIALITIYVFTIADRGPIDAITAACLLYLSHILPASILAWTEKEV